MSEEIKIRKFSWWKSVHGRVFVVVNLWYQAETDPEGIELLEYTKNNTIYYSLADMKNTVAKGDLQEIF